MTNIMYIIYMVICMYISIEWSNDYLRSYAETFGASKWPNLNHVTQVVKTLPTWTFVAFSVVIKLPFWGDQTMHKFGGSFLIISRCMKFGLVFWGNPLCWKTSRTWMGRVAGQDKMNLGQSSFDASGISTCVVNRIAWIARDDVNEERCTRRWLTGEVAVEKH